MTSEAEEKYFAKQEAERRDAKRRELEHAAKELAERRATGDALHTDSETIIERVRQLGFDADTARVFDLMPLIHVAWADGTVSIAERATIVKVLHDRGIAHDSEAALLVTSLLEKRPSTEFLDESLHVLRHLFEDAGSTSLVDLCLQVARSSGGFFGIGDKVSSEEEAIIGHIASELGDDAFDAFRKKV